MPIEPQPGQLGYNKTKEQVKDTVLEERLQELERKISIIAKALLKVIIQSGYLTNAKEFDKEYNEG